MARTSIDKESADGQARPAESGEFRAPEKERRVPTLIERGGDAERTIPESERDERGVPTTERAAETPSASRPVLPTSRVVDPVTKEVEDILSEDLGPFYGKLTPKEQQVFRAEGERAASKIRAMLEHVKIKTRSLIDIIRRWLRLLPGVNKFFLEQEAKIKADRMVSLHKKLHRG